MRLECSECDEEFEAKIEDGALLLPEGIVWFEYTCNWGTGYTLKPRHRACCGA